MKNIHKIKDNIYITSDEEIKVEDWIINIEANEIYPSMGNMDVNDWLKKIILTTDQDLIKDGVQEIDDNFLEWFANNPSCEWVEVENLYNSDLYIEIIIPKEEPKQEIPQVGTTEFVTMCENVFGGKSKQETVEEAAEKYAEENNDCYTNDYYGFIAGAKWQAERMYSEEEVFKLLCDFNYDLNIDEVKDINKWFEQFKKK